MEEPHQGLDVGAIGAHLDDRRIDTFEHFFAAKCQASRLGRILPPQRAAGRIDQGASARLRVFHLDETHVGQIEFARIGDDDGIRSWRRRAMRKAAS